MIVKSAEEFIRQFNSLALPMAAPASPRAVFMVEPSGFYISEATAVDNQYMDLSATVDPGRALDQHRKLAEAIEQTGITVIRFPGHPETPDGVFPNNVFATIPGRFIVGNMLVDERQRETLRRDIRTFFSDLMHYETVDLSHLDLVCELTGPLIIDRARQIGYCGMTQRVDEAGCQAMHEAFDLKLTYQFDLKPDEYHTNVVMAILAGRACVMDASAFADPDVPKAIEQAFPGRTLQLTPEEKLAFAGNCISLTDSDVFMSQAGVDALRPDCRQQLTDWGFKLHSVELDELEKAGGSLRCMIAEIF